MYPQGELEFATLVGELATDPKRHEQLRDLLREDHPLYEERSTAAINRMRGWVLLTLARIGVGDRDLVFVLEELDTGIDPYLVTAAARALRSYPKPCAALTAHVLRALNNIRYRDEPVCCQHYGEYATSNGETSPVRELLTTLAWLGPHARQSLHEIESLRLPGSVSPRLLGQLENALGAICGPTDNPEFRGDMCCARWAGSYNVFSARRSAGAIRSAIFEDHTGARVSFEEFFVGRPVIVVFFYTRCENPTKCSLTITKLSRVQRLLQERGLGNAIRVAAITYDPGFDVPDRMRSYGRNRNVILDQDNRMLRTIEGFDALRQYFRLGASFIGSLVSRHRIEVYLLDAAGQISSSFERLHWDEAHVAERAIELLKENQRIRAEVPSEKERPIAQVMPAVGTLASAGIALFPKCPLCWAAYLSMFGIAGLEQMPYAPGLQVVFGALLLLNLVLLWFRGRATDRMTGFWLAAAGTLVIGVAKLQPSCESIAVAGIALTGAGSLLAVLNANRLRATA